MYASSITCWIITWYSLTHLCEHLSADACACVRQRKRDGLGERETVSGREGRRSEEGWQQIGEESIEWERESEVRGERESEREAGL